MSTITTKQLRENMSQVIDDLRHGKPVQLSYRHKVIGVLQPIQEARITPRRGTSEAIRQGLHNLKDVPVPDSIRNDSRSIKEQVAEIRERKRQR